MHQVFNRIWKMKRSETPKIVDVEIKSLFSKIASSKSYHPTATKGKVKGIKCPKNALGKRRITVNLEIDPLKTKLL